MGTLVRSALAAGIFAVTTYTSATSAAETLNYHLQRAVFRCPKMNRGLAVDGNHFWVGEFGGWVRCYDRQGQHQPSKVRIRWSGAEPARPECPAVVGAGETFTTTLGPATIREIRDPQKAIPNAVVEGLSLRATAAATLGHRTAFARVEQGKLAWWAPIEFEIRAPLEIRDTSVDWEDHAVRLAIRNNTGTAVAGQATVACGAATQPVALQIAPQSATVVRIPAKGLVPGTNPIVVDLGSGRRVGGTVVDWRRPEALPSPASGRVAGGEGTVTANRPHPSPLPKGEGTIGTGSRSFECVDLSKSFNDRVSEIFKHEYRSPRSPYCSLQIPLHGFGDWCYCGKATPKIDDSALRAAAGTSGRIVSPAGIPFATPGPGAAPNVAFTSQWDNFPAEVTIPLSGRARHAWFLVAGSTHAMHSQLDNGEILVTYADGATERLPLHNPTTWWPIEADYQVAIDGFCIPGPHPPRIDLGSGRATILDLPLRPDRPLRSLTVRCLANEVVVGLMSVTLLRE